MANVFEKSDADRNAEKKMMNKNVMVEVMPVEEEKRTTLSLSLTVSDKKALKLMAVERETTIAAIVHEWVQEHLEEVDE